MLSEIFLIIAILFQVGAAVFAFRLIRVTGHAAAWILISVALLLMAVRRIIPLVYLLTGTSSGRDPVNEFIGMVLSGLMLGGVWMIGPIFERIFESERILAESEKRFRSYFELPLVGIAVVSGDQRWLTVNDRLCKILGLPQDGLIGKSIFERMEPDDKTEELQKIKEIAEGKADGYILDKRFLQENGSSPVWASQAARCVRNPEGLVKYYVLIIQDISDRKAYEAKLCDAVKEKETLLRELYHRTKNNMQVICSFLNLECAKCEDPRLAEEFLDIENRIKSMSLVHEQLYRSHDLSNIDLAEYIQELTHLLLKTHRLQLDGTVQIALRIEHMVVPVDIAIPCGLILNELISNSIKHAFPRGRKGNIVISSSHDEKEINLFVSDDGIGTKSDEDLLNKRKMGLQAAYTLTDQINGKLKFITTGNGITAALTFRKSAISESLFPAPAA